MLQKKLLINEINSGKEVDVYVDDILLEIKNKSLNDITDVNKIINFIDDLIEQKDAVWLTINNKKFLL